MNVKRLLFIVLCFTVFQVEAQSKLKPGIRAGANFSRLTNSEEGETDFYIGGLLEIKLAKIYTFQPELVYSRQGGTVNYKIGQSLLIDPNDPAFNLKTNVKHNLDYLSLGIINKFTFGKGFQVMVGPTIDFKVAGDKPVFLSDDLVGFDIALSGGIGYAFSNGLTLEARFKQGMVDIYGDNNSQTNDTNNNGNYDEVKLNQLFQIGASYSFDLKK
ncbi:MAG: PorT family protein [Flavobacterium sp.]|nr:PorT family protein [Flavobacterium sp.]